MGTNSCGCRPKPAIQVKLFACSKVHHSLGIWRTRSHHHLALRKTGRACCQPSFLATRGMQFALMGAVHARACKLTLLLSCTARALTTPRVCRIIYERKKVDAEHQASKQRMVVRLRNSRTLHRSLHLRLWNLRALVPNASRYADMDPHGGARKSGLTGACQPPARGAAARGMGHPANPARMATQKGPWRRGLPKGIDGATLADLLRCVPAPPSFCSRPLAGRAAP